MRIELRLAVSALCIAACVCLHPSRAAAQSRADTAAVLLDAAHRLEMDGQISAARALLNLIRRDYRETAAATSATTMLGSASLQRNAGEESGRVELTVWGTTYGVWLGIATPLMASADEPAAYGAGLLLGAPAGFMAARGYIKRHPNISIGQARAMTFGGTWGTWQGAGWMMVLGDHRANCPEFEFCGVDTGPSTAATVAAMVGGGIVGIGTGSVLARKPISPGVAGAVSASGLWGTWLGLATGTVAGLDDDNLLAATLIGGDATVLAVGMLAPKWKPSVNRVRLVSLSGLVGGVAGGGVVLIVQPNDEKTGVAIPLAASVIGLAIGAHATRNYDRDHAPGVDTQGSSLLHWDGDRMHVGVPAPVPVMRRDLSGPKPRVQPALAVNLFTARF